MNWLILEYERDRELVVCRNMTRLGIVYYHPLETRASRASRNAPRAKSLLKDYPLLPGLLFIKGGPETGRKALSTQYTEQLMTDAFDAPLVIPEYQVLRFQSAVLEYNEEVAKKWRKGQQITGERKKKFVKMTLETLQQLKDMAFAREAA